MPATERPASADLNAQLEAALKDALPKPRPPADFLLAEINDLLRTAPPAPRFGPSGRTSTTPEAVAWRGRATAVLTSMQDLALTLRLRAAFSSLSIDMLARSAWDDVLALLHEARHTLMLEDTPATTVAIAAKSPFDYFEEVRSKLEVAQKEVFFVDAYIDAAFVGTYLRQLRPEVSVRLLVRQYAAKVVPAVSLLVAQTSGTVSVRAAEGFHDRLVFIDRRDCYVSGSSFKDGGRTAPTTFTQMLDAASVLLQTYEAIWEGAAQLFPAP